MNKSQSTCQIMVQPAIFFKNHQTIKQPINLSSHAHAHVQMLLLLIAKGPGKRWSIPFPRLLGSTPRLIETIRRELLPK